MTAHRLLQGPNAVFAVINRAQMIEARKPGQPAGIDLVTFVALFHGGIHSRIAHQNPGDMGFEQV